VMIPWQRAEPAVGSGRRESAVHLVAAAAAAAAAAARPPVL
jgi:hypothetical protein